MNDFITINVNKRFLKVAVVILGLIGSHIVTAKVAYKKGGVDFYNFLMQSMSHSKDDSDASKRSAEKTHEGSSIRF